MRVPREGIRQSQKGTGRGQGVLKGKESLRNPHKILTPFYFQKASIDTTAGAALVEDEQVLKLKWAIEKYHQVDNMLKDPVKRKAVARVLAQREQSETHFYRDSAKTFLTDYAWNHSYPTKPSG